LSQLTSHVPTRQTSFGELLGTQVEKTLEKTLEKPEIPDDRGAILTQ
jgi:hypothetical protein